jgi:hypothetical protein
MYVYVRSLGGVQRPRLHTDTRHAAFIKHTPYAREERKKQLLGIKVARKPHFALFLSAPLTVKRIAGMKI